MRCLMCENLSLSHICKKCRATLLAPQLYRRTLYKNIELFSFYNYDEIKELLFTKHTDLGFHIYSILAQESFKTFRENFHTKEHYNAIAIDDHVKNGYSHTAILAKALSSYNITPRYQQLRATNQIHYSGKSRKFREQNKRGFGSIQGEFDNIILVDDIVTTGATLTEAIQSVGEHKIAFCLVLSDLSRFKTTF